MIVFNQNVYVSEEFKNFMHVQKFALGNIGYTTIISKSLIPDPRLSSQGFSPQTNKDIVLT